MNKLDSVFIDPNNLYNIIYKKYCFLISCEENRCLQIVCSEFVNYVEDPTDALGDKTEYIMDGDLVCCRALFDFCRETSGEKTIYLILYLRSIGIKSYHYITVVSEEGNYKELADYDFGLEYSFFLTKNPLKFFKYLYSITSDEDLSQYYKAEVKNIVIEQGSKSVLKWLNKYFV